MLDLYILRPDAVNALDEPMIKRVLPRYVKVIKNQSLANFQLAKNIEFEQTKGMSIDDLWKIHAESVEKFYRVRHQIDEGKLKDTKKPSLLDLKIKLTEELMKSCDLCEMECHVNRLENEKGACKVGKESSISSEFIHIGEEAHIAPSHTIFFMGCNIQCQYCQNSSISQWSETGYEISPKQLAERIEIRKKEGARNVNLVGGEPTPNLLHVLRTLKIVEVNTPIIWNSNFYMSEKTMKILDGIVDMHLSDFKYGNNECGLKLSKVKNYFDVCSRNHSIASENTEMTIRHLVLPNHVECCTKPTLRWIAENIHKNYIVNIMGQYKPEFKAHEYADISRSVTKEEMREAINYAKQLSINYMT